MQKLLFILILTSCVSNNKPFASIPPVTEREVPGKAVIWLHGEVDRPGKYTVDDGTTVAQMISIAGGLKDDAKSTVILRRYVRDAQGGFQIFDTSIALPCYNGGCEDAVCYHGDEILVDRYGRAWLAILGGWIYATTGLLTK